MSKLLRLYIKSLLTEAPVDVWLKKNRPSLEEEQEIRVYFSELTGKYNALLDATVKDLVPLTFDQLKLLHQTVLASKEANLRSETTQWLTKIMKSSWKRGEDLSFSQIVEDYIPPLKTYQKNSDKFESGFLRNISSIEDLNQHLNEKIDPDQSTADVSTAELGKITEKDGWALYMPHSTAASCELGKTGGRRDTTWCTTRPDASNLFTSYTGRFSSNVILFYLIKKGVKASSNPWAKLSIGFVEGEPTFSGESGGVTVNAKNAGITLSKFKSLLGDDLAKYFLGEMKKKSDQLQGQHPSKDEMKKIANNVELFSKKFESFDSDKNGIALRNDFLDQVLSYSPTAKVYSYLLGKNLKDISIIVARSDNTPLEILDELTFQRDAEIFHTIAGNTNSTSAILEKLIQIFPDDAELAFIVAKNKNASINLLKDLIRRKDEDVLQAISKNPVTPDALLRDILEISPNIAASVADNENLSTNALTILSKDKRPEVRQRVAVNPNTSKDTLILLSNDEDDTVRSFVAQNANTPESVLYHLANDESIKVIKGLGYNEKTPSKVIDKIFDSLDDYTLEEIAKNQDTSPEILTRLSTVDNKRVRNAVAANKNTPPKILKLLNDENDNINLAKDRNTSAEDLISLAKNPVTDVRYYVAANPSTPATALSILAKDNNEKIRYLIASSIKSSKETLDLLSKDESDFVRAYVASNKNVPPETLKFLADDESYRVRTNIASRKDISKEILSRLAKDKYESVRKDVARNKNTPPEALILLSNDESEFVRKAVASHKNTPRDALVKLSNDKMKSVRNNAIKTLSVKENIKRSTQLLEERVIIQILNRLKDK